jgi:hypothetical protein
VKPKALFVIAAVATLSACAALTDTRTETVDTYKQIGNKPMLPMTRNVTSFSDGLRCLDDLFEQYGTNASLMVEDLNDKTQKSAAGVTEMFLVAMSEMTRRSRAVRTVAYSEDTKNLSNFMGKASTKTAFQIANIPSYAVRGGVSQFDDNLAKKTIDIGFSIGPFTTGAARSSSINMVGLDLLVLRADDFSLVPGVSAHNVAAILQEGQGTDADVSYKKFGVNFMTSLSKSDGKAVALRNLVELGAIELMGKLNKVPYWRCLGVNSDHPDVLSQIDDWYDAMSTADKMLFFKQHFRSLGLLPFGDAPVDPDVFLLAFRVYSEVLGFPSNKTISLKLFRAHFAADPKAVGAKAVALLEAESEKWLSLEVKLDPARSHDTTSLSVRSNHSAFVYCFVQDDESKQIRVIFPHGSQRSNPLPAGQAVLLSQLAQRGIGAHLRRQQTLACFTTVEDRSKVVLELFSAPAGAPVPRITDLNYIKSQLRSGGRQVATARFSFGGQSRGSANESVPR